jgi:hypothetical protein
VLSIVSVLRKPECPIFEFKFLSRFIMILLLRVFHVIVITCFYSVWKFIEYVLCITL